MTDKSHEPVRWDLILRLTLQVLSDESRPMRQREVVERVSPQMAFTSYETELVGTTDLQPRWVSGMGWLSVDLKNAGWLTKEPSGWLITEAGREALNQFPSDGSGMLSAAQQATNALSQARYGHHQPGYRRILDAAFEYIEPGQWTTYGDLAALAATNAQTVGTVRAPEKSASMGYD